MGIIDDYLNAPDSTASNQAILPAVQSSGLIEQYLNAAPDNASSRPKVIIDTTPKPPISGATKEQSNEINAQPSKQGGANPRDTQITDDIRNYPSNLANNIGDKEKEGFKHFSQGTQDVLAGKLGTGALNAGIGALQMVTAPVAGTIDETVTKPLTNITGNPDFGDKAGLLASLAVPVVPGAGVISKALPKNRALSELVDNITSSGRDPQALVDTIQQMKANPRIGPADTSSNVLNMAQDLFVRDGAAAKGYLYKTSSNRLATSKDTINSAYDDAAGLPVNAVNKLQQLSTAAKEVGSSQINPAITGAKPVNISPVIEHIDNILKPGVMKNVTGESSLPFPEVKKALATVKGAIANNKEQLTDSQALHSFQSALRREAEARLRSGDGGQRQIGKALMDVRNKVVSAIDEASPQVNGKGTYKPALSSYRDEMDISDAFHDAYNGVLTNSKKLENRPEFTKQWFDGLTDNEKQAAIEGIRTRIDTEIGTAKNPALAGTSLGKSDFNKQKMEAVLGKEETNKLLQTLDNERAISNTHNKIIEGSQTAMRMVGKEATKIPEKGQSSSVLNYALPIAGEYAGQLLSGTPGVGAVLGGATLAAKAAGSAAKHSIAVKIAKERNLQLAKMSLPTEGPSRDQLIKDLEAHLPQPRQSLLVRGAKGLSRIVAP